MGIIFFLSNIKGAGGGVKKEIFSIMLLLSFSFGVICKNDIRAESITRHDLIISLDLDNQELKDVLMTISTQTGFTVNVDSDWISNKVTGNYSKISVENFFHRILRGNNISVLVNEDEKSITVRSFGKKVSSLYSVFIQPGGGVEPLSGVAMDEIEMIRIREQKELDGQHANIEPLTGISMSDIKSIQANEEKSYQEYLNDPESVEKLTGMKLSEIRDVRGQEQEEEVYGQETNIEPLTGVSLSEIASIQANEEKSYQEYVEDPNSTEPLTGMTLREIEEVRMYEESANK